MKPFNGSKRVTENQKRPPHKGGAPKRLRERFLKSGLDGFHDYEVIELLLTLARRAKTARMRPKPH
jgi:DNA repair protein RadC